MERGSERAHQAVDEQQWEISDEELDRMSEAVRGCYCLVNCQIPKCSPFTT